MSFLKDLTGGNPFSTRIGQLIEQCTDGSQASENWGMLLEVCDVINETDDGPKDAIRAIKKRLSTSGKNYTVVMYTLTLLETCVKNCGRRFHVQVAHKDFLQEMIKIIGPKNDPPQVVQEKVLSMIQTWADAFQGQPELKEVGKVYQDLKNKGIEFPMTDLDSMAPIHTPARTGPEPVNVPQQVPPSARATGSPPVSTIPSHPTQRQSQRHHPQQPVQQPVQRPAQQPEGPVMLGVDQLAKLKSELDVVQQNTRVFSEMLTEMTPGQENPNDMELLSELNRTCKQMQQRIMELINGVQNEEVTCELLHINDELNNVFLRYERFERLRASQTSPQQQQQQQPLPRESNTQAPPTYSQVSSMPAAQIPSQPAQPPPVPAGGIATANLIDLGETPSPQTQPSDPFSAQPQNDINARLAGLSVNSSVTPSTVNQLSSTQATTGSNPRGDDDFDMFAQSRQSFDSNKQQLPGAGSTTYSAQQTDQFPGGLGSAVTAKSTGNPFTQTKAGDKPPGLTDDESDLAEMEQWLKENPTSQPESATSSEFDRFLQERADDASGNRGNRGGRQLQKDNQDDAMFAL